MYSSCTNPDKWYHRKTHYRPISKNDGSRFRGKSVDRHCLWLMRLGVKVGLDCKRYPDDLQLLIPSHRLRMDCRLTSQVFGTTARGYRYHKGRGYDFNCLKRLYALKRCQSFMPSLLCAGVQEAKYSHLPFSIQSKSRIFEFPLSIQSSDCFLIEYSESPLTKVGYTGAFIQCIDLVINPIHPPLPFFPPSSHLTTTPQPRPSTTSINHMVYTTTLTPALVALTVTLTTLVNAGGYQGPHNTRYVHWGAPESLRTLADERMRNECSGRGSFMAEFMGGVVCVSEVTRVP
jgi:hypothetical protein